ncbi:hypothetical protein ACFPJ1_40570 [Kribbella qitaiheensis]|uniref:hypothetical protein n=1 Tax=Kribbella qitaiheensis TaxID=1544730 RepID=UPI00360F6DF4
MSNENETKTDTAEVLKTAEEWCQIEGVQILDADGWRGRDGRDWTDPISLAEFQERLATCTQRSLATQPAGPHHTGTLDLTGEGNAPEQPALNIPIAAIEAVTNAFYEDGHNILHCSPGEDMYATARAALTAALPALRRQIAEEIAVALEAEARSDYDAADDLRWAANKAREIGGKA